MEDLGHVVNGIRENHALVYHVYNIFVNGILHLYTYSNMAFILEYGIYIHRAYSTVKCEIQIANL